MKNKYLTTSLRRIKNRSRKNVISKFAEKTGLLYFGYVDQHSDEHKVVRGLTVSSSHRDDHFCVGSVSGYNLSIVDRSDYTVEPNGANILNGWITFAFELQTKTTIPHFFIGAKNRNLQPFHSLFSTFPNMKEFNIEAYDDYEADFTSRFSIYARPAKSAEIRNIISAEISRVISAHFWPLSIEQHDNVLYLYSTSDHISAPLLDTMLKNGLWLAGCLDQQTEAVDD